MAVNTHEEGVGWWEECDAAPGRREAKVVLSSPRATFQTADYFQWFYIPQQHWGSRSGWTRQILFYSEYKNPPQRNKRKQQVVVVGPLQFGRLWAPSVACLKFSFHRPATPSFFYLLFYDLFSTVSDLFSTNKNLI